MKAQRDVSKREVSRMPERKGRFSAGAAVLVAGLALGAGCRSDEPIVDKKGATELVQKVTPTSRSVKTKDGCTTERIEAVNIVVGKKGRCEFKEGDDLLKIEFIFEKAGFFSYSVSKIDEKGVEIAMDMEIFMTEHASNRGMPWRIDFGETKGIGRSVAPDGTVDGKDILTVKAEKGATPGTAILTITYPKG